MARVLVTGAGGLLGGALVDQLSKAGDEVICLRDQADVDLGNRVALERRLTGLQFSLAFHVAALTSVERAEKDPEAAWSANVVGTRNVAALCRDRGARLLYVSTSSVFDGLRGGYRESEAPKPINYYSWTKLLAEESVLAAGGVVMRATIIGVRPGRPARNFLEWLVERLASDADFTLYTDVKMNALGNSSAARIARELLGRAPPTSVWHVGTTDLCSKAQVGEWVQTRYFPAFRGHITYAPISDVPGGPARPREMWLDVTAVQSLLPMPTVSDELHSLAIGGSR